MTTPYLKAHGQFDVTPVDQSTALFMYVPDIAEPGDVLLRVRLFAPLTSSEQVQNGWTYAYTVAEGDAGTKPIYAGTPNTAAAVGHTFPVWYWCLFGGVTAAGALRGAGTVTVPTQGVDSIFIEAVCGFAGESAGAPALSPSAGYTTIAEFGAHVYDPNSAIGNHFLGCIVTAKAANGAVSDTLSGTHTPQGTWGGGIYTEGVMALSGTASATGQIVAPATANIAAVGTAPTLTRTARHTVAPATGNVAVTGYAPSIARAAVRIVAPATANIAAVGTTPALVRTSRRTVSPATGRVAVTGHAPGVARYVAGAPVAAASAQCVIAGVLTAAAEAAPAWCDAVATPTTLLIQATPC